MMLTDLITAFASLASLGVAAFATVIAWKVHSGEDRRLNAADQKAERTQANLVAAWETSQEVSDIDEVPEGVLSDSQIKDYGDYVYATQAVMHLVNRSMQPVYDVQVHAVAIGQTISLDILPPGEQKSNLPRYKIVDYSLGQTSNRAMLLSISFRDSSGNWWVRKEMGELIKVTSKAEQNAAMGPEFTRNQEFAARIRTEDTLASNGKAAGGPTA